MINNQNNMMNTNTLAIIIFVLSYLAIALSVNVCELFFSPFPFISVDNASYRKVKLLQKISAISNGNRKISSNISTTIQDNTSLIQYTTIKSDKENNAINLYLQQPKSLTVFLSDKMTSEIIIPKDVRLGKNANLISIVKPGDKVSVNDPLIVFEQSNKDESINKLLANIGEELKEEVSELNKNIIKSKYTGYIADVKVYSVSPLEELSPSLRKFVDSYWKQIREKKNVLKKYDITKPDDTGNLYMETDEPIVPLNGKVKGFNIEDGVLVLIFIAYQNKFGIGDKLVNYSALKGVCTEIWKEGNEPYTESRPNEEISALMPAAGVNYCAL